MRILIALSLLALSVAANASQLDLAVVQFPEAKTAGELDAALAKVNLAGITNSDRTMTSESYLKGGYVIFAQSLPLTDSFASSTRLSNSQADVEGRISGGFITVKIILSEGVQAGLRRFSSRTHEGKAALVPGQPRVLSVRQVSGKTTLVIKGQPSVKESSFCSAIIAQISK